MGTCFLSVAKGSTILPEKYPMALENKTGPQLPEEAKHYRFNPSPHLNPALNHFLLGHQFTQLFTLRWLFLELNIDLMALVHFIALFFQTGLPSLKDTVLKQHVGPPVFILNSLSVYLFNRLRFSFKRRVIKRCFQSLKPQFLKLKGLSDSRQRRQGFPCWRRTKGRGVRACWKLWPQQSSERRSNALFSPHFIKLAFPNG